MPIRCQTHTLGGFSGHAGRSDLTRWLDACATPGRTEVCLVHGDYPVMQSFAAHLRRTLGLTPRMPSWKSSLSI